MASELVVSDSEFQARLRFETLLADLSSNFINLAPAEVDQEIEDALRRVCELAGIDLAVLWQSPFSDLKHPEYSLWMRVGFRGSGQDPESVYAGKRMRNGWKNWGLPWTYGIDPERVLIEEGSSKRTDPDQ